jgi:hypothetical protein
MDWGDIALHAAVAAAAVLVAGCIGLHWHMAVLVAVVFVAREAMQARAKYGAWLPLEKWSAQKLGEAIAPIGAALICAIIVEAIG